MSAFLAAMLIVLGLPMSIPAQYPPDVIAATRAGAWLDWAEGTTTNHGLERIQAIEVKQSKLGGCWDCPYITPYTYTTAAPARIIAAAQSLPGSLWYIGNECEFRDLPYVAQNEMTPELYAVAFHDLRAIILAADPTARIAPCSVIRWTPLRAEWYERVLAEYERLYGDERLPVDWWNTHAYGGPEYANPCNGDPCWGAGIPAGVNAPTGRPGVPQTDFATFRQELLDLRAWLVAQGYPATLPLMVSEWGSLDTATVDEYAAREFIFKTEAWFGTSGIVQAQALFCADGWAGNYGYLDPITLDLTPLGQARAQWLQNAPVFLPVVAR